jgi:predicted nucleotidyltransferase component of viral defense system
MNTRIIEDRLKKYGTDSAETALKAIREITQELILFALSTSDFFSHAAFQGGTCLRIVHGLNRFSEDMDFTLKTRDPTFSWQQYLALIGTTLEQYGYSVELQDESRVDDTVKKAFIKDDSIGKVLRLAYANRQGTQQKIRIKLEIDTNPPGGGEFETAFIGFPAPSSITTETLPTLFAGKSHALLCRTYEKGRDWYDFLWYMGNKTSLNYPHLCAALNQVGPWAGNDIIVDRDWYITEMKKRIEEMDWARAKDDVSPFISRQEQGILNTWSADLFLSALARLP